MHITDNIKITNEDKSNKKINKLVIGDDIIKISDEEAQIAIHTLEDDFDELRAQINTLEERINYLESKIGEAENKEDTLLNYHIKKKITF